MEYEVKTIRSEDDIESCNLFRIDHLLWGTKSVRPSYGRLGYLEKEGLFLTMTCEETKPLRTFHEANTPVYLDSAMEAFFSFDQRSPVYLNFEMNANGALLAMYGPGRVGRRTYPPALHNLCGCKAAVDDRSWNVTLRIPIKLLTSVYKNLTLEKGSRFSCNFYKISETASIEHYASFSPVLTPKPDFHRPDYFSEAVIVS